MNKHPTRARLAAILAVVGMAALVVWFVLGPGRHQAVTEAKPPPERAATHDNASVAARSQTSPDELLFLNDIDRDGNLRLEGQVVDADDHAVANAEITVSTNPPRTTHSEADGSFTFTRLVGRSYNLSARADAGFAGPVTARLTANSEPVILKLRPAGAIEVRTVAADSKPVAGATVEVRGLATLAATITSKAGADGRVVVTGVGTGRYMVVAWATGFGKTYEEIHVPTAMQNGEVVARLKLTLQAGVPVAGRVVSPDGVPVQGAVVRYSSLADFRARADVARDSVATDASGGFRFEAMPRGTFRFQATHASFAPGTSKPIQLDGATAHSDVEIRMEPGGSIEGRVVSTTGAPVGFATVRVTARTKGAAYEAARQTYADADGRFEISGLPRREMLLVALDESATSEIVPVDLASTPAKRDLVIKLDQVGTIAGTVVDDKGAPVAGAAVWATLTAGTGDMRFQRQLRGFSQELTDSSGGFAIHGLVAGDYIVYASRTGGASPGSVRLDSGTPAKVGDLHVKVVLPEEGGVAGVVQFTDGTTPPLFTVRVGTESKTSVPFATSDGRFRITNLAVGTTSITVTGPTFDPATRANVVITSGAPTDVGTIMVEKGRTISGRVLDADGQPVAEAKVYAGPRIFGNGAQAGSIDLNLPGARDAVMIQATSESDGFYSLHGIGIGDLALMAEHDTRGRSALQTVPASKDSSTIDLVLLPFAAVDGTVTKAGQPLPDIAVTAASQSAATSTFVVSTGPDGSFRFDHLAPDTYKVSAVTGRSPKMGFGFAGQTVAALGGKTVTVHLEMNTGASLLVHVGVNGGKPLSRAIVYVMAGAQTVASAKTLTMLAASVPGFSFVGAAVSGAPARADSVPSGHYTVCAIAIPNEVDGMAKAFAYVDREGANMPAVCAPFDMKDAPAEQNAALQVDVPKYVPPPDGTQDPGGSGSGGGSGSSGSGGKGVPRLGPGA